MELVDPNKCGRCGRRAAMSTTAGPRCDCCAVVQDCPDAPLVADWDADYAIWKRETSKDIRYIVEGLRKA